MIEELLHHEESTTLDFKKQQYLFENAKDIVKAKLLRDILSFANAWRSEDAYILIGVEEVKGGESKVLGIGEDVLDDAQLQQFVNSKTNKAITFDYKNHSIQDKIIGIIKIPVNDRPIYLNNNFANLKKNVVYMRRGSSSSEATPDDIIKIGLQEHSEKNIPILKFSFANKDKKLSLEQNINISSKMYIFDNINAIPDCQENASSYGWPSIINDSVNKDYYRELVSYYLFKNNAFPLSFSINNLSTVLSTDINVEITVASHKIKLFLENKFPSEPIYKEDRLSYITNFNRLSKIQINPDINIQLIDSSWHIDVLFSKARPGQSDVTEDLIYFIPYEEGAIEFNYKIFADNIPSPIEGVLIINSNIDKCKITLEEIQQIRDQEFQKKIPSL